MDDPTKITLSDAELEKVLDKEWILTKLNITEKVYRLFGMHAAAARQAFEADPENFGVEISGSFPKISKGENYLQLPYVMLDYPSVFGRENIFAIRTMFWWGNFFSCTLLLKGHYQETYSDAIIAGLQKDAADIFICISGDEWDHHFETTNYVPAAEIDIARLNERPFIKLALRFDLGQWNNMPRLLEEGCKKLIGLMRSPLVI